MNLRGISEDVLASEEELCSKKLVKVAMGQVILAVLRVFSSHHPTFGRNVSSRDRRYTYLATGSAHKIYTKKRHLILRSVLRR
jgi:hypothetical protein